VREGEGKRKREKGKRGKEEQGKKEGGASVEFAATIASARLSTRHGAWVEE
jgi:hypothetical protein